MIKTFSYQGGKSKIGGELAKIIIIMECKYFKNLNQTQPIQFYDLTCGLLGVTLPYLQITNDLNINRKIIANDINKDLITMWKKLKNKTWFPNKRALSAKKFDFFSSPDSLPEERAFYSIVGSFNNEYLGYYRNPSQSKQNYLNIAKTKLKLIVPLLKKIQFYSKDMYQFEKLKNCSIYIDPPYENHNYKSNPFFKQFDYKKFWQFIRVLSKNNLVLVSSYTAPKDFKSIWHKEINYNVNLSNVKFNKIENLFIHKNIFQLEKKNIN